MQLKAAATVSRTAEGAQVMLIGARFMWQRSHASSPFDGRLSLGGDR